MEADLKWTACSAAAAAAAAAAWWWWWLGWTSATAWGAVGWWYRNWVEPEGIMDNMVTEHTTKHFRYCGYFKIEPLSNGHCFFQLFHSRIKRNQTKILGQDAAKFTPFETESFSWTDEVVTVPPPGWGEEGILEIAASPKQRTAETQTLFSFHLSLLPRTFLVFWLCCLLCLSVNERSELRPTNKIKWKACVVLFWTAEHRGCVGAVPLLQVPASKHHNLIYVVHLFHYNPVVRKGIEYHLFMLMFISMKFM